MAYKLPMTFVSSTVCFNFNFLSKIEKTENRIHTCCSSDLQWLTKHITTFAKNRNLVSFPRIELSEGVCCPRQCYWCYWQCCIGWSIYSKGDNTNSILNNLPYRRFKPVQMNLSTTNDIMDYFRWRIRFCKRSKY